MERMGDILAKVAGKRASIQSKTRRTMSARKTASAAGASSTQKAPPALAQQEYPAEVAPRATTQTQAKANARPSVQASAPARQPQPVRRPNAAATQALPDALESPKASTRAAPDAEPILEMPTRRRASAAPMPTQTFQTISAMSVPAEYTPGASLRLNSAALRAPTPPTSPTPPPTRPSADAAPVAPARPVARTSRQAAASTPVAPSAQPVAQAAEAANLVSVARARSAGRPPAAGMLPLGAAAQGYLAAISSRRQQPPRTSDATEASQPQSQQRAANRRSAQSAVGRQSTPYGLLEEDVCPICGGMGYVRMDVPVGDPMFGQAAPCECKERQREEHRRSDLRRISSLDAFDKKTFETFDYRAAAAARDALEIARRYADDPQGWLILSGGYGVGKTHLAAAIANYQLSRGAHVFFSIVPDLLDHLRAAFAPSSESPFDEMFDRVREAGLLVLDDLGAENSTAWATEKLFQLINYRYNYRMPTVITTNHRLLSHIDERINSRLSDLSLVRHVAIDAPDYRQRHAGRPTPARGRSGPRG